MVQLTEGAERELAAQGLMGAEGKGAGCAGPDVTGSAGPRAAQGLRGAGAGCAGAGVAGGGGAGLRGGKGRSVGGGGSAWRAGVAASLPSCREAVLRAGATAAGAGAGAGVAAAGAAAGGAPPVGCVTGPGPHLQLELVSAVQGCRGGLWVVQVGGGDRRRGWR